MPPLSKNRKQNRPPKKSQRKHVPALDAKSLRIALEDLQALNVDDLIKRQVADVLKAASNPDSERIDVVIRSLPKEQRKMIDKTAKGLNALNADVQARGKGRLDAMSEGEWERLVNGDETN